MMVVRTTVINGRADDEGLYRKLLDFQQIKISISIIRKKTGIKI